jgi:hypothetical protein
MHPQKWFRVRHREKLDRLLREDLMSSQGTYHLDMAAINMNATIIAKARHSAQGDVEMKAP